MSETRESPGDDAPEARAADGLVAGDILAGRYRLTRFIAAGGMGEVFAAEDLLLGEVVAVKTIRPAIALDRNVLERFRREVSLARKVTHRNVCRIFELAYASLRGAEVPFLVMELLDGETLSERIARGPLALDEARPISTQLALALDAAHAAGVLHRDFKSHNVMLVGDRAVVTDFGLARSIDGLEPRRDGAHSGTPGYMAPEQWRGRATTPATDVYAFGVVLFEMLTGERPFPDGDRRGDEVAPRTAIDPRWDATIARMLSIDPAARFASAGDAIRALQPTVRRRRSIALAAFALVGVLGTGAVWAMRDEHVAPTATTTPAVNPPWTLPADPAAAAHYVAGMTALRVWDYPTAKRELAEVVERVPDFAQGHRAYAEALGGSQSEAKLAFDRSASSSRADRLHIEAYYRQTLAEYDRSADLYEELYRLIPDDFDHGMATFHAEINASRRVEARRTLDSLRELAHREWDLYAIEMAEGHLADALGDYRSMQASLARAGVIAKAKRNDLLLSWARDGEQWALYNLGEPQRVRATVEELRELRIRMGDTDGAVATTQHLATLAMERGELSEARRMYDEVIAHFRPQGFDAFSMTLSFVVDLELRRGRMAELDVALDELDQHGPNKTYEPAIALHQMMIGRRLEARGDLAGARAQFEGAEAIYRKFEDNRNIAATLVALGRVLRESGDLVAARSKLEEANTIRKTLGAKRTIAESQTELAALALAETKPAIAEALAREAETEMGRQGALDAQALAGALRARAVRRAGRDAEAREILAPYRTRVSESAEVRMQLAIASGDRAELDAAIAAAQASQQVMLARIGIAHRNGSGVKP